MAERSSSDNPSAYLRPPTDAFWCWAAGGAEVEWRKSGKVIAFRDELRLVLARQAERGLPPLGAVLLVLAAARESWDDSESERGLLAGIVRALDDAALHLELLSAVHDGLDQVRRLSDDLRNSIAGKVELVDMLFETCRDRTSPQLAAAALQLLHGPLPEDIVEPVPLPEDANWRSWGTLNLERELKHLRDGLPSVSESRLRLRMRTGLDAPVVRAPIELSPPQMAAALIQSLRNDEKLGGLGRIAHDLMAAVTLPRTVSQQDVFQLGGISDIANRGQLDQLLLSELVHDDLTLAVRVSMNEALYVRREAPPRAPPRTRTMLLDSGLRTWGVPRVFAAAVALAMAATTDHRDEVVAWRANGQGLDRVDLTSRQGLLEHLERLTTAIHPGDALPKLVQQLENSDGDSEAIIVATADTLADPEFQRALAATPLESLYLASVNREGEFRLSVRVAQGQKLLRHAELDLEKLLAAVPRGRRASLVDQNVGRDLPAILSRAPFPLRLPHTIDDQQTWPVGDAGVLSATSDGRLMGWGRRRCGALQISDQLPRGVLHWHSPRVVDGVAYAVIGPQRSHRLSLLTIRLDEDATDCEIAPLPL
ncbi:MAG: hypothetical protein KDA41_03780, partial [Planctomycetales bacterium]|nr:hypothetical protein [Planctomycetales bacterium]